MYTLLCIVMCVFILVGLPFMLCSTSNCTNHTHSLTHTPNTQNLNRRIGYIFDMSCSVLVRPSLHSALLSHHLPTFIHTFCLVAVSAANAFSIDLLANTIFNLRIALHSPPVRRGDRISRVFTSFLIVFLVASRAGRCWTIYSYVRSINAV